MRRKYRPFLHGINTDDDWVSKLELDTALRLAQEDLQRSDSAGRLKILVLYGSLRPRYVFQRSTPPFFYYYISSRSTS